MFKFQERTLENFRHNAEFFILSDRTIRALFDIVSTQNIEEDNMLYNGSFAMFLDIKTDDECVEFFEDENNSELSIKELTEMYRQLTVAQLKDFIIDEIEYI